MLKQLLAHLSSIKVAYDHRLTMSENLASPVVDYVTRRAAKWNSPNTETVLSDKAWASLANALRLRLSSSGRQAVDWMWQAAVMNRGLLRPHPAMSSDDFMFIYFADGVQVRTLSLLHACPALARLWMVQSCLWVSFTRRFVGHARAFLRLNGRSVKSRIHVASLQPDWSDLHCGNRSVMRVRLSNGEHWYYKPRSGVPERMWTHLLSAVNDLPVRIHFMTIPKVISGRNHCWVEAVSPKACRTKEQAAKFFFKCGVVLYLLHCLRGVDFHAANLVAHASDPVLIDCETLLHPQRDRIQGTILATGFLPFRARLQDSQSALGRLESGRHTVRLQNRVVVASDFTEEILAGFRILGELKKVVVSRTIQHALRKVHLRKTRQLFRATNWYEAVLAISLEFAVLTTGANRWRYLQRLCCRSGGVWRGSLEALALEQADIPVFYSNPARPRSMSALQLKRESKTLSRALEQLRVKAPF